MRDPDCTRFLQWALPRLGMRWAGFRKVRGQVCKRVTRRLRDLGLADGTAYREYIAGHPGEWDVLDGLCRITISRFYRDRAVFDALGERGFLDLGRGALARGTSIVRCWSAGCASGEEPYSLSLAWAMTDPHRAVSTSLQVVATEVDPHMLHRARTACYPPGSLKELPDEWIGRAFAETTRGFCLQDRFKEPVTLVQQDIREVMPDGPFDLVMCRNLVFTYFDSDLQIELLGRILERINPGGLLILGGHEALPLNGWPVDTPYGVLPIHRIVGRT